MTRAGTTALAMGLSVAVLASADQAQACGGFFCSSPSQPVAQAGEQIAFSIDDDGTVTAIVEISWQGPAESFAWIVPVPTVPEISVGTNALFDGLWNATAVTFASTNSGRVEGVCRTTHCESRISRDMSVGIGGCGGRSDPPGSTPSWTADAASVSDASPAYDGGGGVTVLGADAVGPYEYVILEGVDTPSINTWLVDHEYLFPPEAVAALDPYVTDDFKFVVLRMRKAPPEGADIPTGDLVPLVMRYSGGQPCIPVRLTAIATVPDMPITAYFLANDDVRPLNYLETEVPDEVGFWRDASTYWTALSDEVDRAGGRAFVAEYRGSVPSVPLPPVVEVDHLVIYTHPRDFASALFEVGLGGDSALLEVMLRNLPPPPGVDALTFYNCLAVRCGAYDEYLDTLPFDPVAFVADLERSIVEPRRLTRDFVRGYSRLTRLTTTMSAEEMTIDPEFRTEPTRRDVSNLHNAELVRACSDLFAPDQAPTILVTSTGFRGEWLAGTPFTDDETYCRARGLEVSGDSDDTCGCRIERTAPTLSPMILGLAAATIVLRRHFRRRRR